MPKCRVLRSHRAVEGCAERKGRALRTVNQWESAGIIGL